MNRFLVAPLLVFACGSDGSAPVEKKLDPAKMQGTWILKWVEAEGEKHFQEDPTAMWRDQLWRMPEGHFIPLDVRDYQTRLTFKGNDFLLMQDGRLVSKGTFEVDAKQSPPVLNGQGNGFIFCSLHGPHYVVASNTTWLSVISLEGDTLRWSQRGTGEGTELPPSVSTNNEAKDVVLTFTRDKN